jgi:hypothetical protein
MNKITFSKKQIESKNGKRFDVYIIRKEWRDKATNDTKYRELQLNYNELKQVFEEIKDTLAWQSN